MKWLPVSQRSQMLVVVGLLEPRVVSASASNSRLEHRPGRVRLRRRRSPAHRGRAAAVRLLPCGTASRSPSAAAPRLSGRSAARERGLARHHAAADVHADGGRNDRALGRDHAADGRADADVHVRHDGDVLVDERQPRRLRELLRASSSTGTPLVHIFTARRRRLAVGCSWVPWWSSPSHCVGANAVPDARERYRSPVGRMPAIQGRGPPLRFVIWRRLTARDIACELVVPSVGFARPFILH